jgi:uncharacterized protein (DUF2384 family)
VFSTHDAYFDNIGVKECAMTKNAARKQGAASLIAAMPHPTITQQIIEADTVAEAFGMTKPALALTLGLGRDALMRKDRADARKSQQRLREVMEIIALVRDWAGSEIAAMSWYRATPIPAFGGRTAEAVVKDGNAHLVREYIDHLALGGYA